MRRWRPGIPTVHRRSGLSPAVLAFAAMLMLIAPRAFAPPPSPNPPQDLTATATSDSRIDLKWHPPPGPKDGYNIYRSTSSPVTVSPVNLVGSSSEPEFADTGLEPLTTYYYIVTTYKAEASPPESAPSSEVSATTPEKPSKPRIVGWREVAPLSP